MSYAVSDFNQQCDCLERVLELHPHHRKAQARLEALMKEALPAKDPLARLQQIPLSRPAIALILVFGCMGLMVIGYLGSRFLFPSQTEPARPAEIAQIVEASLTAAFSESESASARNSTPTLPAVNTQTLPPPRTAVNPSCLVRRTVPRPGQPHGYCACHRPSYPKRCGASCQHDDGVLLRQRGIAAAGLNCEFHKRQGPGDFAGCPAGC